MADYYPEDEEIIIMNGRVVKSGQQKANVEYEDLFKPKDPAYYMSSGAVQKGDQSHKRPEASDEEIFRPKDPGHYLSSGSVQKGDMSHKREEETDIFKPKDPAYYVSSGAVQKGDMSHKRESNYDDIFKPKDPAAFVGTGRVAKGDMSHKKADPADDEIFKPKDPAFWISSGQVQRGDSSGPAVGVSGLGRLNADPNARKTLTEEEVKAQYYKAKGIILAGSSPTGGNGIDLSKFADPSESQFPYSQLRQKPYPEGVDPERRELYLNDEDFQQIFSMDRTAFSALPAWKQVDLKKKRKLF